MFAEPASYVAHKLLKKKCVVAIVQYLSQILGADDAVNKEAKIDIAK